MFRAPSVVISALLVCFLVAACAEVARAQSKTFAQALAALSPNALPSEGFALVINAENRKLPAPNGQISVPNPLPAAFDTQSVIGLVNLYGLTEQSFGKITALGPAKMRLFNPNPAPLPFSLANISRDKALRIFAGSLTDSQLHQLGSSGIGIGDLNQEQAQLFAAIFAQPLNVIPEKASYQEIYKKYQDENPGDPRGDSAKANEEYDSLEQTLSISNLESVQLTCRLTATYFLDEPGDASRSILVPLHERDPRSNIDFKEVHFDSDAQRDPMTRYFAQDLPNTLKDGDLNWNARPLGALVSVAGVKTANDIVQRAAQATGLELYCDPRYGDQSATLLGDVSRPVKAEDLLKALCLCVTGVFRQVGPAYVLTDDLPGVVGIREKNHAIGNGLWDEANRLSTAADLHFIQTDWLKDLSFAPDDPDALPPGTIGQYLATASTGDDYTVKIPFGQLPAQVQQGLHDYVANTPTPSYMPAGLYQQAADDLKPAFPAHVYIGIAYRAEISGVGAVSLDSLNGWIPLNEAAASADKQAPSSLSARPKVPITATIRGVLCAPKTAEEARAVVDKMAAMGMNMLYCDAFTNGKAYVLNPAMPPDSPQAAAVLGAAVEEGRQKGIAVIAVIDTLCWRQGVNIDLVHDPLPAGAGQDLAATGETSLAATRRLVADGNGMWDFDADPSTPPPPVLEEVWMDPGDQVVQNDLSALVRAVASTQFLAGIAFRDTAGPGYVDGPNRQMELDLGYTPEARLAFLRKNSADPIDVEATESVELATMASFLFGNDLVFLNLPEFDGFGGDSTVTLSNTWSKVTRQTNVDLMSLLWSTAKGANANLPVYVQDRRYGDVVAPWTNPKQPSEVQRITGPAYYTSQIPSELSAGAALIADYSDLRKNPDHWYGATEPSHRSVWNATVQDDADDLVSSHGRGGVIFNLVDDPSPDGPLRDLEVISEHIHFAPPAKQPAHP